MNIRRMTAGLLVAAIATLGACGSSTDDVTTAGNPPPDTTTSTSVAVDPPQESTTTINGEDYTCPQLFGLSSPCGERLQSLFDTYTGNINAYVYDKDIANVFSANPNATVGDVVFGGLVACAVLSQEGVGNFGNQYLKVVTDSASTQAAITDAKSYVYMWVNAGSTLCPEHKDEVFGTTNPGSSVIP